MPSFKRVSYDAKEIFFFFFYVCLIFQILLLLTMLPSLLVCRQPPNHSQMIVFTNKVSWEVKRKRIENFVPSKTEAQIYKTKRKVKKKGVFVTK